MKNYKKVVDVEIGIRTTEAITRVRMPTTRTTTTIMVEEGATVVEEGTMVEETTKERAKGKANAQIVKHMTDTVRLVLDERYPKVDRFLKVATMGCPPSPPASLGGSECSTDSW